MGWNHVSTVKPIWIQYVLKKPGDTLLSGQRLVLCCLASSSLIWDSCYLWYNVILHWIRISIARCAQIWYSLGTLCNPITTSDIAYMGVLILHAASVGLTDRPAVISGRHNKYHSLQLQNYYAQFPPLQHTHIHANTTMRNWSWEWSWASRHCMLAVAGGILCDRVKRPIGH